MSGHSHWSSIKGQKAIADAKKGQAFSKLARLITIAAKEGGADPAANSKLRLAIEKAKIINMPRDNVDRAIKRGSGELGDEKFEEVSFEAYGPGGIALIIDGITDNKNRALGEVKQILLQRGGKLVNEGAMRWMFEKKGVISFDLNNQGEGLKNKEGMELSAIESGAEDFEWAGNFLYIYTKPEDLEKTKKSLEEKGLKINSASLDLLAKDLIEVNAKDKESCQKLFEELDESEAVQNIYSNLKN
jgi:YebC/PmpR family DNA-binding regulatory protein